MSLLTVNLLAVGHYFIDQFHTNGEAELLTPDGKWTTIDPYPFGLYAHISEVNHTTKLHI